jgi:hypothetical protein
LIFAGRFDRKRKRSEGLIPLMILKSHQPELAKVKGWWLFFYANSRLKPVKINVAKFLLKAYVSYMICQLSFMIAIVKRYNDETIPYLRQFQNPVL